MTNDLITRAKEYLERTEGINEGEEWDIEDDYQGDGEEIYCILNYGLINENSHNDVNAINLTPTARALIAELVKEVEAIEKIDPKIKDIRNYLFCVETSRRENIDFTIECLKHSLSIIREQQKEIVSVQTELMKYRPTPYINLGDSHNDQ